MVIGMEGGATLESIAITSIESITTSTKCKNQALVFFCLIVKNIVLNIANEIDLVK